MATAVQSPSSHPHTSYRHHTFSTSSTSSQSTHTRSTLQKQSSSYRTIGSAGMASFSSYSSTSASPNYTYGGSSYDPQPQHLHGKLHKRSHSKETPVSVPSPTQEEFFPPDSTHHKKGIIKPLKPLIKKVQNSTNSSGKLDLGKPDGGNGGVFYNSSPYIGGRSSATDLTSFVPTHRQQHKRTISGNSASSSNSVPNYYPRRYAPTPTQSYPNSIGDSESNEDDDDYMGEFGTGKASVPALKIPGAGSGSPLAFPPRIPISESAPISPVSPIGRTATMESFDKKRKDSFDRKRKIIGGRNSSEEYTESVRAARQKFEQREKEREEKEERKARKSISKEDRRPSNDGTSTPAPKSRWTFARHSTPDLGTTEEKTIGIPYGGQKTASTSRASLKGLVMRGADEGQRSRSEKRLPGGNGGGNGGGGFKNQWQGFVMWVRFGFIKMGRKVRSFF
ncbi:hypothetical protein ABW19_dt0201404 [Dactylella cylindrospora]|nr:hypothetical protein ABW19_dt0201404 [Dactylella cylindrospora]